MGATISRSPPPAAAAAASKNGAALAPAQGSGAPASAPQCSPSSSSSTFGLASLHPGDSVSSQILKCLTAVEINTLSLTSKGTVAVCHQPDVWLHLCQRDGKIPPYLGRDLDGRTTNYRHIYWSTILVQSEAPTIGKAIERAALSGKTVALLPGVHQEPIALDEHHVAYIAGLQMARSASSVTGRAAAAADDDNDNADLTIRAWDPSRATVLAYCTSRQSYARPAIEISSGDSTRPKFKMVLEGLQIRHSVPGTDIWRINAAILVSGRRAHLHLRNCLVTSASGRGINVVGGAKMDIAKSTVYDCAATGVYVSHPATELRIDRCNIVNNGYGGRLGLSSELTTNQVDTLVLLESIKKGVDSYPDESREQGAVWSNHSGVYVSSASASAEDSLVTRSCYTGISIIKGGSLYLNGCDILGNGDEAVATDDEQRNEYLRRQDIIPEDLEGCVTFGSVPSHIDNDIGNDDDDGARPSKLFRTM